MKRALTFACVFGLLAAPASAQEELLSACSQTQVRYYIGGSPSPAPPPTGAAEVEDQFRVLCGQAVNALTAVQPSIGIAFSGGNHTLGTATTIGRRLGAFPRISVTARVNGAFADAPDLLDDFEATLQEDGRLPPMGTTGIPVGSLQGDVTLGLFNGLGVGGLPGGLGAVDLLGSVSFIPSLEAAGLEESIVNWGAGLRIGILRQGLVTPGISVSGMYRTLGDVSLGSVDEGDPAEFSTSLSTLSLRAAISKGILAFDFAAGAGYDIYTSDVHFDFELNCPPSQCTVAARARPQQALEGELKTSAWNVFANVGLNLLVVNLVGEVGYQKATDMVTLSDLEEAGLPPQDLTTEDLDAGRLFGSLGLRLTF